MKKTQRIAKLSLPVKISVCVLLIFLVLYPIGKMFSSMSAGDFSEVFHSSQFPTALKNSLVLSGISTLIVIIIAYLLAFFLVRFDIKIRRILNLVVILPMLIPSISHGMGLIILFGGNGIIKNMLGLTNSIYGPVGIVTGSVLYAFPVAYIMFSDVLKYEDMSVYEAADILGISKARQFFRITLPYMKRPLIAAAFSTFSMIITDYGVPLMIGGKTKTLSLMMYEDVIGQLKFSKGAVYGTVLLIPAIVAFVTDIINKERGSSAYVHKSVNQKRNIIVKAFAVVFCIAVAIFAILPIISFVILAFAKSYPRDMSFTTKNILNTLKRGGDDYLLNSIIMATLTALFGTILSYITAYLTSRMKSVTSRIIHLLSLTFMAIPGIVLGLSYATTFSQSVIYGTMFILVMVNIAHFMSSPYLMMYNTFGKMNENLESVGDTLGIGRVRMIKDVFLPQTVGTVAEMFSYLFVNCMMTISAVSFLSNMSTRPISLMINQFEAQSQYECAAVVSLFILLVNILMKLLVGTVKMAIAKTRRKAV